MSVSASATRDSTAAFGGAVGRDNSINMDGLVAGAGDMDRGRLAMGLAKADMMAAGKRSRLEASERDMAAGAYDMAGAPRAARAQRRRAKGARKRGSVADKWASNAAGMEDSLVQSSAMWEENIAESSKIDGWRGDRAEWTAMHAGLQADIESNRAKWNGLAERAAEAKARAEGRLERASAAAERTGASAGLQWQGRGKGGGRGPPGAREAVDAWLDAMRAAELASGG